MSSSTKKLNPQLEIVLRRMCKIAGVDYDSVDFKEDGWYTKHTWTRAKEKEFKNWLIEHLRTNNLARKALLTNPAIKTKKALTEAVDWFLLDYSWKYEIKNGEII